MATIGDFDLDPKKYIDESLKWLESGKLSELKEPGYFTVAQVAALIVSERFQQGSLASDDVEQALCDFIGLVSCDIADGTIEAKNPLSMLPWAQYLKMIEAGYYDDGDPAPMPDMGWLVHVDEAKRWYDAKGFDVDFTNVKADMESNPTAGSLVSESSEHTTWQEAAREIADEIDARDAQQGAHDSITSIADRVAARMRERGIGGAHGPLTGATIKREALQGGLWARHRNKAGETGETGETGGVGGNG